MQGGRKMLFNEAEFNVLKRYHGGDIVREEDRYTLERLSSTGLIHCGFSYDDGYKDTARLTQTGKKLLRREQIFRNPFLSFLYRIRAATF